MKYTIIGFLVLLVLVGTFATVKKVSPLSWGWWGTTNTASSVALKGHDAVAYFKDGAAALGDSQFSHEYADAIWQFASAESRDRFAADPDRYAPQFGGFCAFATSKGFTADASPDAWHIEAGKLYVFMDGNVRDQWVAAITDGSLETSEKNWAKR